MRCKDAGFTLVEAMISMAVVGVLLMVAVPAWTGAGEGARSGSARAALLASISESVSRATLQGSDVVLCPGDANGCRATTDWSQGWIVYSDMNGNRSRDAHEKVWRVEPALGGKTHLRSTSGRTQLVIQPSGGNGGSNVTFTLCDGRGVGKATTLILANTGRLRNGIPTPASAAACMQPAS